MQQKWRTVEGTVVRGYQVASGIAKNSPYPRGTIEMQTPFFQALGLDLTCFFPGTLNVFISPSTLTVKEPEYTFRNIRWIPDYPAEDFSFSRCRVYFNHIGYDSLIYYPHPETKINHFQNDSLLEILTVFIPEICYGSLVEIELNSAEIIIK